MTVVFSHPKDKNLWGGKSEKSGKDWWGFFLNRVTNGPL